MVVEVVMPKMGESITEGTILEWRKEIGDPIEMDEILLEIGTDKVDSEIPSANAGILVEILAEPNEVVEVGKVIARIETDSDSAVVKKQEKKPVVESSSKEVVEPDSKKEINDAGYRNIQQIWIKEARTRGEEFKKHIDNVEAWFDKVGCQVAEGKASKIKKDKYSGNY